MCTVLSESRYGVRSSTSDKVLSVDTLTENEGDEIAHILK